MIATTGQHAQDISSASLSVDGLRVVTASFDGTAKLWDADDGKLLDTFAGNAGVVWRATMSPDGKRVVTANRDKAVIVWDILRLNQSWDELARDACMLLLGPENRKFSQAEIDADQLLTAEWPEADRDVCQEVRNVATVRALQSAAGIAEPTH